MNKNIYTLIGKFECYGNIMVTVIIKDNGVDCVIPEFEY